MAVTINGVYAEELIDSYSEGAGRDGLNSSKKYLMLWQDRIAFVNGMLGLSSATSGPYGIINFVLPVAHPEHSRMLATSSSIQGVGNPRQGSQQLEFDYAIVTISYGSVPWEGDNVNMTALPPGGEGGGMGNPESFTYASFRMGYGAEYLIIPREKSKLQFETSGRKIDQDYPIPISLLHLGITFHKVPYLPWPLPPSSTKIVVGSLNQSTTFGAQPGHLKYDGADTSKAFQSDSTSTQEYTVNFTHRDIAPWDAIYDHVSESFDRVVKTNGDPIIPRADFSGLIPRYSTV